MPPTASPCGLHGKPCQGNERAPGAWRRDCVRHGWVCRARAWDVSQMEQAGQATAHSLLEAAAAGAESALVTFGQKEPTVDQAIRIVEVLLGALPSELLVRLVDTARQRQAAVNKLR